MIEAIRNVRRAFGAALQSIGVGIFELGEHMNESDTFEVVITKRDVNGGSIEGKVASKVATVYVVARKIGFANWEPLYAEKKATGGRVELPHCFSLRAEAIVALEGAAREK